MQTFILFIFLRSDPKFIAGVATVAHFGGLVGGAVRKLFGRGVEIFALGAFDDALEEARPLNTPDDVEHLRAKVVAVVRAGEEIEKRVLAKLGLVGLDSARCDFEEAVHLFRRHALCRRTELVKHERVARVQTVFACLLHKVSAEYILKIVHFRQDAERSF